MKFLGNVLAVIVGLLVFSVISFFILAGIIAIAASSEGEVKIKENTVLVLNLEGRALVERTSEDQIDLNSLPGFGGIASVGLVNLKKAIQEAAKNENVKGIYLQAGMVSAGQAMLHELREELISFKESGKFIVAYSEIYTEGGYFLSSAADEVYMNPLGGMEFNGIASEIIFFKGLFEKLEIEPVVFRVGEFKSAVEPFLLDKMSDENRLQTSVFLNDLNDFAVAKVAESRSIDLEKAKEINSQMLVRKNSDAVDLNLVDGLWYEDQVKDLLREKLGLDEDDDINTINVTTINKDAKTKNILSKNKIAVIIAQGEIVSGTAEGVIASESFVKEVNRAKNDESVKAIVVRVNSPGGSALASEVMWRALEEAKKEKPIIASMGEYAASGGYYISAPADTIVAQPNTITGSIGIFGLWFNAEGLMKNKLGLTTDVVKTGELSDFLSFTRQLTDLEKSIFQNNIEDGYDTFISRVADGRNMTKEEVLEVASGRVWSGIQGKENGLVDVLGGLEDAIEIAAIKAGVEEDYKVAYYPQVKPWFEKLMADLTNDVQTRYMKSKLGSFYPVYNELENIKKYEGMMLRMPYDLIIE
ncbi:signal peptide peptidase SppA, 67K type [Belliella baltica DSM 15883]|uniref:Signal peptide peptidase SppA, 67K type n=1 Tax=Belliella baltica (strain DSM 15883 / CIP 108006 / LMG 21964 / BA134) TaxID=866536 RepID=I3Z5F1_BELBD|nr:signal peptide peptidase SppA [Belliella baltica]AFL84469.1 signal peptide peptidase SppA, 67K type [Belliella baltica DSM 15883]